MKIRFIPLCAAIFLLCSQTCVATQLYSYADIKNHLLQGSKIQVVVDLKNDCVVKSHEGNLPYSPNTWGATVNMFLISYKSGDILLPFNNINAPDDKYGANYLTEVMSISPNNTVEIEGKAVGLPDYKVFSSNVVTCTIANKNTAGVKFLVV